MRCAGGERLLGRAAALVAAAARAGLARTEAEGSVVSADIRACLSLIDMPRSASTSEGTSDVAVGRGGAAAGAAGGNLGGGGARPWSVLGPWLLEGRLLDLGSGRLGADLKS